MIDIQRIARFWARVGLVGLLLPAGCGVPLATVNGRSLAGRPLPPGPMAMLPSIYSPVVQYQVPATAFSRNMLRHLQRSDINIVYDDLDGQLAPRVASTQVAMQMVTSPGSPATQTAQADYPASVRLALEQRYQYWQQKGFAVVVQPVVRRYGYYPRYVPAQVSDNEAYWYHNTDTGWYGGWGEGPNPGWESNWGGGWGENRDTTAWNNDYGAFARPSFRYSTSVRPASVSMAAEVSIEYQFFDVPERLHIYHVLADSSSFRFRPAQLERGFGSPLVKAFRQAYTGSGPTTPQTRTP